MPPLVNIIMPTYNRADLLPTTLNSILTQSYENWRLIVVDDGSTDGSRKLIEGTDERITYIWQENQGQASARKKGLEGATGEFVCMWDSDDLWEPQCLEILVDGITTHDAGLAFSNYRLVYADGKVIQEDNLIEARSYLHDYDPAEDGWVMLNPAASTDLFTRHFPTIPSGSILRRSAIVGTPDPRIRLGDDCLFFTQSVICGQMRVVFTRERLWAMRVHGQNIRQQTKDFGRQAYWDIQMKKEILARCMDYLNRAQAKQLKKRIAQDYFDWGYSAAKAGERGTAIVKYWQSFRYSPSPVTILAMMKGIAGVKRQTTVD